jgi:plasmid replication initiation protein
MKTDPKLVNTIATLGVTPSYVLQRNSISRSAHTLSATAQKLAAMAMALLPTDLSSLTAAFTYQEFCDVVGLTPGGDTYKIFRSAVSECMKCSIYLETKPNERGKKKWTEFVWFVVSRYDEETGQATMKFSEELAGYLLALKFHYSKINLKDIGKFKSKYSIRIYQFALSLMSFSGKDGNAEMCWFVDRSIEDLRMIMGVKDDEYKVTNEFKRRVIDGPVEEVNKANLGVEIKADYKRQGRKVVGVRLECKKVRRHTLTATGEKINLPDEKAKKTQEDKELDRLMLLYPREYTELYIHHYNNPGKMLQKEGKEDLRKRGADIKAKKDLKKRYGIRK